jgi:hypothetical protein
MGSRLTKAVFQLQGKEGITMGMRRTLDMVAMIVLLGVLLVCPAGAQAFNSAPSTITLRAVLNQSLSVTLSGISVNFILIPGRASSGSNSITATTTWAALPPNVGSIKLYAFFANSESAMMDGEGDNIPSAGFQISDNGGAFAALTNTVPFGGASRGLLLSTTPILGRNRSGSRTDVMIFNIDLLTQPNLPARTYRGSLAIQAQASP